MWQLRIDRCIHPDKVTITATYQNGAELFTYKDTVVLNNLKIEDFVQQVISQRETERVKNATFYNVSQTSQDILNALNTADGIKDIQVFVTAENSVVLCKKLEVVEPLPIKDLI